MSRAGTTQSQILARRKKARLSLFLRRAGLVAGIFVFAGWLGAWVVLSGAVPRIAHAAQQAFYEASAAHGFAVDNILVKGRVHTDADVLLAIVNVKRGDPLLSVDPREMTDLIERISWVKEAHVERRLPDTLYIALTERKPLALWQNKGKVRLIDEDGVTLADAGLDAFHDLLLIVGEDAPAHAPDLVAMLAAEPVLQGRVESATRIGGRRWDLVLKNDITARMPDGDMGLALRRLAEAQEKDGLLDKDLEVVDLRESDRITVKTRPGAVQEYKASYAPGGGNI